jgi:acetylornithine deacetylase/succinyl-diaminopimelate desuccinylase-like protein
MSFNPRYISELKDFLSFPTVSSDSTKKKDIQRCAQWLATHLQKTGLKKVKIFQTRLHPLVYAEYTVSPELPTILFYGHYDVQPAIPLQKWKLEPFSPVVKGDYIYGRGTADDKGQLFIHIKAIEEVLKKTGKLPVNVKCLFEGEEEIGSPNLPDFIRRNKEYLKCDAAVVSDTKMLSMGQPAITYSLRGTLNMEITITGKNKELHSGSYGGMVYSPLQVLCEVVSKLYTEKSRISIPGFYADVENLTINEKKYMAKVGPSDERMLKEAGTDRNWGEEGYSNFEKITVRPAISITTIKGGYQGEGFKNVIPASASIKLNVRLVPNQNPLKIEKLLMNYFTEMVPRGFELKFNTASKAKPVLLSIKSPYIKAASESYKEVFGKSPVFLRSGGTIPVVNMFKDFLKAPTILMGFGLPSDNIHAPNENFHLPTFFKGIQTSISFMKNVSAIKKAENSSSPETLLQEIFNTTN